jgi:3-phenylpropionate/trans-cinnamate dioxygenase ferredoxin reductase component
MRKETIILGAGHAGVQAAASLREEGYDGAIRLIDAQIALPYQRPPLSKAFMKGETSADLIVLRGEAFYREHSIDLLPGIRALRIDRAKRRLGNVFVLRDIEDALRIKAAMAGAERIVVIGGGFIGLEFAAVAAGYGKQVTVVEAMPRVMARAVSEPVSLAFQRRHEALGVALKLGTGVLELTGVDGKVSRVMLADGSTIACDMVVVGIGVLAEDRLAVEAGLDCANGIVTDEAMRTSDPSIFAIGDVNSHRNPFFGGMLRLEAVQNAVDQAKTAAKAIAGQAAAYHAVPWFWSDQADLKLQIAGVAPRLDQVVLRGDPEAAAFSAFGYAEGSLRVVESVNRPADHMMARRMIAEGRGPLPAEAADPSFDLRAFAMGARR